jgi:hypothetical protein
MLTDSQKSIALESYQALILWLKFYEQHNLNVRIQNQQNNSDRL